MYDLMYLDLMFCNREINKFNRLDDRRYEEKLTASLDGEAQECFLNGARARGVVHQGVESCSYKKGCL